VAVDTLFTTEVPGGEFSDGAPGLNLGTTFFVTSTKQCVGVQARLPSTGLAGMTARIWVKATGLLVPGASANFVSPTASAYNTALFASPVTLVPGVAYVASYWTPARYMATASFWTAQRDSAAGIIHGAQSGSDPVTVDGGTLRNGVFIAGAAVAYPANASGTLTCYFVGPVIDLVERHHGTAAITLAVAPAGAGHKEGHGNAAASLSLASAGAGTKTGQGDAALSFALQVTEAAGTKAGHGGAAMTLGLATAAGAGRKRGIGSAAMDLLVQLAQLGRRFRPGHPAAAGHARASLRAGHSTSTLTADGE